MKREKNAAQTTDDLSSRSVGVFHFGTSDFHCLYSYSK